MNVEKTMTSAQKAGVQDNASIMLDSIGFIRSGGYLPASVNGIKGRQFEFGETAIGILKDVPRPTEHESVFAKVLRRWQRADFMAVLWFENPQKRADGNNWVLEVKGEKHLHEMKEFAGKLSSKYNVNVRVDISSGIEKEMFVSDLLP